MMVEGQGLCPEGHTEAPRRPVELVQEVLTGCLYFSVRVKGNRSRSSLSDVGEEKV